MRITFIASLFALLLLSAVPSRAAQNPLAGYWEGVGNLPNDEVKFTIKFKPGDVGIQGTIDIPDSGFIFGSPLSNISVNNSKVHFARRGIATLIYDNRGSGESTGYPRAGFDDLAGDVLAALQLLKGRKDIDPKQIGLWAGSQAGWISPLAASRSKDVAFVMLMSG